jgi:PAS domain S-box-containing protein
MPARDLPWQSVVEAMSDGVVLFDADDAIIEVNEAFVGLVGRSRGEIRETPAAAWWDQASLAAACAEARRCGSAGIALTLTAKQGEPCAVAIALRALPQREGWIVGTVRDDRALRELERSQQRWRSIVENPFDFVVVIDREYRYEYVNHLVPGLTRDELIGKRTPFDFVDPEHHPAMQAAFERAFHEARPQVYDTYVPIVDRWMSTIVGPIVEDGSVVACSLLTRDITDGMRAIEALRQNEQRLELAIEGGDVGIFEIDLATRKAYFSPRVHDILGWHDHASATAQLDAFTSRIHGEDRERTAAALEHAIATGEPFDRTFRIGAAADRWLRGRGRTVRDGAVRRFSGFVSDVTEQVRAETERRKLDERVHHGHRLETLGTVASGIAHEFNNLLVPMLGNAEHARGALQAGLSVDEELSEIVQACHRARDLVKRILVFSRPRVAGSGLIDVVAVVREATTLVRASLPPTIELACRLPANRPLIAGDDGQLHQAIVNLCTNARQAIGSRAGRIEAIVEAMALEPGDARRLDVAAGPVLRLSVVDDGPGIAADVIGRVFDPFFTTRSVGEGTGLGLWIVHQVVRAQRGAITVTSTPGHGARFEMWFSIVGHGEPSAGDGGAAKPATSPPRRILFVDDEAMVRTPAVRMLRTMGHDVVAVDSAEAALQQLEVDSRFDLVLTDQSMPGITGIGLANRLLTERPGLPVVVITGVGGFLGETPVNVIAVVAKPWRRDELTAAIAKATGTRAGP